MDLGTFGCPVKLTPANVFQYLGEMKKEFKVMHNSNFGWALEVLKDGGRVCRSGWNGKGMWLELQLPDFRSKMSLPYIYMFTAQGDLVPWLASQTDVLAEDWQEVTK